MRSYPIVIRLLAVAGAGLLVAADAPDNLVFNGDFERVGGDKPAGWHAQAARPEHITGTAGNEVHGGTRAIKLSEPKGFHDRWAVNNDKRIPVTPGTRYRFSAWVKVSETWKREFVQLRAEQFDESGALIRTGADPFLNGPKERPAAGEWTQIKHEFTPAEAARSIRPLLALTNGGLETTEASVIIDDVVIEKID